jgi:hypothetical protein
MILLELAFPGLQGTAYKVTSPATSRYNCIAWAAGDEAQWWEPDPFNQYHWPPQVPRQNTIEAYAAVFESLGYEACEGPGLEAGFEKVAVYCAPGGSPTHAARQLTDGSWTSKLGQSVDITHIGVTDLNGGRYGAAVRYFRRSVQA